jgi:6-phosphogluconate dehydrogenase
MYDLVFRRSSMQIGYIGLGKMGKNMVLHLLEKGHQVVAWNRSPEPRVEVASAGAQTVETVEELVSKLEGPKLIWLMLPAGDVTGQMVKQVADLLAPGDTIIEGANSFFKDTVERAKYLKEKQIHFIDAGVSGGPSGARNGACVMIGGDKEAFQKYEQLFKDISAPDAYRFFEGNGAGHFVKMVHNGIEYGMMQAIAEGFHVLKASEFTLDLLQVAQIYQNRSVIESRLIGWVESGLQKNGQELENISGTVAHSGEGQWTVETAKELGIPTPIIEGSLQFRIDSQNKPSYTGKLLSMMRNEFGGHKVDAEKK